MFKLSVATFVGKTMLTITERLDEYRLVFEGAKISPSIAATQVESLLAIAEQIPTSDSLELQISFDDDTCSITDTSVMSKSVASKHLDSFSDSGDVKYELIIRKPSTSVITIYDVDAFGTYLSTERLNQALEALSSRFESGLDFVCMTESFFSGSETIRFHPKKLSAIPKPDKDREKIQKLFQDCSHAAGFRLKFLPSDFHLSTGTSSANINAFMEKACTILSVVFLSNTSDFRAQDTLIYKLVGYKSIESSAGYSDFASASKTLYELYEWAYEIGGSNDKLGLARNVVSLHTEKLEELTDDNGFWNAINSNYQIYLNGNLASYLEIKNSIAEFLMEASTKNYKLVEDLIDSVKNSVFVMLTFILTVVVVNGLKDTSVSVIFSIEYFYVVTLLCVALSIWIGVICITSLSRFDNSFETTKQILLQGYGKILLEKEITDCVDPFKVKSREYFVSQSKRYALFWSVIALVICIGFWIGYSSFNQPVKKHSSDIGIENTPSKVEAASSQLPKKSVNLKVTPTPGSASGTHSQQNKL